MNLVKDRIRARRVARAERLTEQIDQLSAAMYRLPFDAEEDRARLRLQRERLFWKRNDLYLKIQEKT